MPLGAHASALRGSGSKRLAVIGDWLQQDSENSAGVHTTGVYPTGLVVTNAYIFVALFSSLKDSVGLSNVDHDTGTDYPSAATWTLLESLNPTSPFGFADLYLWGKHIVDASLEPPSYRMSWDASGSTTLNYKYAVSVSDADIDGAALGQVTTFDTDVVSPSLTASDDALLFSFARGSSGLWTPPPSMELLRDGGAVYGSAYEAVPVGSTGTRIWTLDSSSEHGVAISALVVAA